MQDRELLKLALETIEQFRALTLAKGLGDLADETISALRARLADQRPRVCCKDTDSDGLPITLTCNPCCSCLSQPEQRPEPVAYPDRIALESAMKNGKGCDVWPKAGDYERRTGREPTKLFTSPPELNEEDRIELEYLRQWKAAVDFLTRDIKKRINP